MRERLRKILIRAAWFGLFASACLWLGLQLGRPLYYTDGSRQRFGLDYLEAAVLRWPTPEPHLELPGPVRGRIAALADGRLVYGRERPGGDVDLVAFDPRRPGLPPEALPLVNTPHHELAPAIAADGALWFASDRPGGRGGFDLWRAAPLASGFAVPEPAPKGNTALDETDPALSPDGLALVFARVDPELRGGENGVLFHARLDDELDPEPLFVVTGAREDRDPLFAADGRAMWFVRRESGGAPRLLRAVRHLGAFDAPVPLDGEWGTRDLRSPLLVDDGFALLLLHPGDPDLLYRSAAEALQPWWPGQRLLELLLLAACGCCALLLLLLYLGRRFRKLDLVTICLLLSLLLHLLLLLWLMPLEIVRGFLPGPDDGGGLEVQFVTEAPSGGGGAAGGDLAAEAQFQPETRQLSAEAPSAVLADAPARAERDGPAGEWQPAVATERAAPSAAVADATAMQPTRTGSDAAGGLEASVVPAADQGTAARTAAREGAGATVLRVGVPTTEVAAAADRSSAAAPAAGLPELPAAAADGSVAADLDLRDAVPQRSGPLRTGDDPRAALDPGTIAARAVSQEAATGLRPERGTEPAPATGLGAQLPGSALAVERSTTAAPAGTAPLPPVARGAAPAAVLQDRGEAATPRPGAVGDPAAETLAAVPLTAATGPAAAAPFAERATIRELPRGGAAEPKASSLLPSAPSSSRSAAGPTAAVPAPTANRGTTAVALRDAPAAPAVTLRAEAARPGRADLAPALLPALAPLASAQRPIPSPGTAASAVAAFSDLRLPGSLLTRAPALPMQMSAPLSASLASAYSNRFGPAKVQALERFGGTVKTERAVADGLRYLASIQGRDGAWGDKSLWDSKYGRVYVGKTGLCVLAFLGAGHTHQSHTEHSRVVAAAVNHLLSLQDEDGAFGPSSAYGHGIATYALAECYGITKDPRLLRPVERALTWIIDNQGPRRDRRNRGGWGYFSPGLQREDDHARMSITAWMVMALESARLSGIDVPDEPLRGAREFCELAWDQNNGWFRYNHLQSRVRSGWPTLPASTPAGAFAMMLLGTAADDERIQASVEFTVERRPRDYRRYSDDDFVQRGAGNVYFWYYGTLCCFLAGGESWERWNTTLRELLPAAQSENGSFAPIDVYARYAGDHDGDRSYTTAMCVLCLEVYYRYFTPLLIGR